MSRSTVVNSLVLVVLVALGAGSRFLEIAPNFAAVAAVGLFAGSFFRGRVFAAAAPIGALVVSDVFLPAYPWHQMAAVYGSMALSVLIGSRLNDSPRAGRIVLGSLTASMVFFVITNFAVWAGGMYGLTWSGLARCYVAAVPFIKYTLAGDLVYSAGLFGAAAIVRRAAGASRVAWARPACDAVRGG